MDVSLRNERGEVIESGGTVEAAHLPDYCDPRYPYLGLIDPYGDTMFGSYQMVALVPELERWSVERPSHEASLILDLARRCAKEVHVYLWFVGD
jgi:hypothetical protein